MWPIDAMAGQNTGKTVAIILGGAAGVAFLVICLLFARGLMKKHDGRCFINMAKYSEWFLYDSVNMCVCICRSLVYSL